MTHFDVRMLFRHHEPPVVIICQFQLHALFVTRIAVEGIKILPRPDQVRIRSPPRLGFEECRIYQRQLPDAGALAKQVQRECQGQQPECDGKRHQHHTDLSIFAHDNLTSGWLRCGWWPRIACPGIHVPVTEPACKRHETVISSDSWQTWRLPGRRRRSDPWLASCAPCRPPSLHPWWRPRSWRHWV